MRTLFYDITSSGTDSDGVVTIGYDRGEVISIDVSYETDERSVRYRWRRNGQSSYFVRCRDRSQHINPETDGINRLIEIAFANNPSADPLYLVHVMLNI